MNNATTKQIETLIESSLTSSPQTTEFSITLTPTTDSTLVPITESSLPVYDIETQYEEGVGEYSFNYGSMFHILSFQNISIISLDIHTSSTSSLYIQVWSRKGNFVGFTDVKDDWILVFDQNVTGNGIGNPTSLNSKHFTVVNVTEDDIGQSFFILSPHAPTIANLIFSEYNNTQSDENEFVRNSHLNIFVGIGISNSQAFSSTGVLDNQVWSGAVWYNVQQDEESTLSPIMEEQELITMFSGTSTIFGNLFDVYALDDIVVKSLDIHTDIENNGVVVKVYTRQGSLRDNSTTSWDDWVEVANTRIKGNGQYVSSPIPSSSFTPVIILKDTIQSFFITLPSKNLVCTEASAYYPGALWKKDDHVKLSLGVGTDAYPVTLDDKTFFHDNIGWNGVLRYSLDLDAIDLSREFSYYVLINHSVDKFFDMEEYLVFVKGKWESGLDGYLGKFEHNAIANNGNQSPFCDVYTTGIISSNCYILQISLSLIYKNQDAINTRQELLSEAQKITAYFISDEPTTSLVFIGPQPFHLTFICTFTGYFDHVDFVTEDLDFLESSITTFLKKEFEENIHGTKILSTDLVKKEVEITQDSRRRQQQRLLNMIGSLSINATITGEIYSTITPKTTLMKTEMSDLILDAFYASEQEFLDSINTDATFENVKYITFQVPEQHTKSTTSVESNGFTRTWFIIFVVGLVFVIIPLSLFIEYYMRFGKPLKRRSTKSVHVDEEQPLQPNGRKRRGSVVSNSKRGSVTTTSKGATRAERRRASNFNTPVVADLDKNTNDEKKRATRRRSLPSNIQIDAKDEKPKHKPKKVANEAPRRRRFSTGGALSTKELNKELSKAGISHTTALNTSTEDMLSEDDEEALIKLAAKAYGNIETEKEDWEKTQAKRRSSVGGGRRASIGAPNQRKEETFEDNKLQNALTKQKSRRASISAIPSTDPLLNEKPFDDSEPRKPRTRRASVSGPTRQLDEFQKSHGISGRMSNEENRAPRRLSYAPSSRSRRFSISSHDPSSNQLNDSARKSSLGSLDQSVTSHTSNEKQRAQRRVSISNMPSRSMLSRNSRMDQSVASFNKSLDGSGIVEERRNSDVEHMPSVRLDDSHGGIDQSIGSRMSNDKRPLRRASLSHMPSSAMLGRSSNIDNSVNSFNNFLGGDDNVRRPPQRRVSVSGLHLPSSRQLDDSHRKSSFESGLDHQSVSSRASNENMRVSLRASLSHATSSSMLGRSSRGVLEQSVPSFNQALDDSGMESNERRNGRQRRASISGPR